MSKKTIKILIIILSVLLALLVLAGVIVCRQTAPSNNPDFIPDPEEPTPEPQIETIEVESIRILVENNEVMLGTRFWPEVIIYPDNATDKNFELHSDNELVIRLQGRNWTATGVGTANLIATSTNGTIGMITITVLAPELIAMEFMENDLNMVPGDSVTLTTLLTPRDAGLPEPIRFSSGDTGVATVDADGRVTAVGAGSTVITAASGNISTEINVSVGVPVRSISVSMNRRVFAVGDRAEFTITIEPPTATNAAVSVSFSGAAVTSVGANAFVCDEPGEITITFTAENGSSVRETIVVHDLAVLAEEVLRLTNAERSRLGLQALNGSPTLDGLAAIRARELLIEFSHTRPDGRRFSTVFTDNNIEFQYVGENLAGGQSSPAEVVRAWIASEEHYENIKDPDFGNLGVSILIDNDGRIYWVQLFMN